MSVQNIMDLDQLLSYSFESPQQLTITNIPTDISDEMKPSIIVAELFFFP